MIQVGLVTFLNQLEVQLKDYFSKKESNDDREDGFKNEIINKQNFVEGYWEINENTEKIKDKYEKKFNY